MTTQSTKPKTTTATAVIYARVSSVAQMQKGHGLGSQETRCREFARLKGYEVAQVFCDEAVSGGIIDRPGMLAMLKYLKANRRSEHVVLIDDISRLARDMKAHLDLRDAIAAAGARLESPSIEFGEDSDSILVENLLASVSQHQRQKNAEQTRNRMRARIQNGYWPFISCIGLKHVHSPGQGKVLVRDEPLASIIQEGMEGFASGRFDTQAEVKRFFESFPAFPKNRSGMVRNTHITEILTKPLYAGYVEAPDWGVPLRKGQHEGLVSFETFERIQRRLKDGARAPARADLNVDFPLRGAITCACCERPLTAAWSRSKTGKRHAYYACFNRACPEKGKSIRRDQIEGEFAAMLNAMTPAPTLFAMVRAMMKHGWDQRLAQAQAFAQMFAKDVQGIEKQIDGLLERIIATSNPTVIAAYENEIATLEREKLVLEEKRLSSGQTRGTFEQMFELAMTFFANPSELWHSGSNLHRKLVLKLTFAERLSYCRKNGFSNPNYSLPFKMLSLARGNGEGMADREGFEPSRRFPAYTLSRRAPSTTRPPVLEARLLCGRGRARNPCGICEAAGGAIIFRQMKVQRGIAHGGVSFRVMDTGGGGAGAPWGGCCDLARKRRTGDQDVRRDPGADRRQRSGGRGKLAGRHGEGFADAAQPAAVGGARPCRRCNDADLPADGISGKAFHESRRGDRGGVSCRGGGRVRLCQGG